MILLLWACAGPGAPPPADAGGTGDGGSTAGTPGLGLSVDPEVGSILRASWEQPGGQARLRFRVAGEEWREAPTPEPGEGERRAALVGLPYGAEVEAELWLDEALSASAKAWTDPLPDGAPQPAFVEGDPTAWDPQTPFLLLSLAHEGLGSWVLVLDRQGRTVWARKNPNLRVALHPRVSREGSHLLIDENSYWGSFDQGADSRLLRMRLDGSELEELRTPGLHHPFVDLPDGSILYAAMDRTSETLVRRWPDGRLETVWDCKSLLATLGESGFCGSNTLWYDEASGRVLDSLYSLETVVELDLATATPTRWFGNIADSWAFEPEEARFWWQHGACLTAEGTLLLSTKGTDAAHETLVREYALDEERQTLVQVWSFGEGEGIYGGVMGEAHRLPGGNTLHNYGSATRIREITPEGRVVWDIDWELSTLGRSTPIADLDALMP